VSPVKYELDSYIPENGLLLGSSIVLYLRNLLLVENFYLRPNYIVRK
jgi:hypothetical protein